MAMTPQDFLALDCGIPKEILNFYGLAQFPLVGQALVMAYNIPALSASDPSLVRDSCPRELRRKVCAAGG